MRAFYAARGTLRGIDAVAQRLEADGAADGRHDRIGRRGEVDFQGLPLPVQSEFQGDAVGQPMRGEDACRKPGLRVDQRDVVRPCAQLRARGVRTLRRQAQGVPVNDELTLFDAPGDRVGAPDELEHGSRHRCAIDGFRGVDLLDPAVAHHHHAVGQLQRLLLVVGHEQHRLLGLFVQSPQPAPQLDAHLRIERTERFVEQEHARVDRQCTRQRDTLLLPARQLVGIAVAVFGQLHQRQQLVDPPADGRLVGTTRPRTAAQAERHVAGDVHVLEERVMLEDEADVAFAQAQPGRVVVAEHHVAAVRVQQPCDDPQQRGLAGAGGAEQRDEFSRCDVQVDVVQRRDAGVVLGELSDVKVHDGCRLWVWVGMSTRVSRMRTLRVHCATNGKGNRRSLHLNAACGCLRARRRGAPPARTSTPASPAPGPRAATPRRRPPCCRTRCRGSRCAAAACW